MTDWVAKNRQMTVEKSGAFPEELTETGLGRSGVGDFRLGRGRRPAGRGCGNFNCFRRPSIGVWSEVRGEWCQIHLDWGFRDALHTGCRVRWSGVLRVRLVLVADGQGWWMEEPWGTMPSSLDIVQIRKIQPCSSLELFFPQPKQLPQPHYV